MLLDGINSVLDSLQKTNGKLATLNSLLEAGEAKLFLEISGSRLEAMNQGLSLHAASLSCWKARFSRDGLCKPKRYAKRTYI